MTVSDQQQKIQIALTRLRTELCDEVIVELVQLYLSNVSIQLEKLNGAIARDELKSIRDLGHAIKSTSANLGVESLQETCLQIENSKDTIGLNKLYMRAKEEFQTAKKILLNEIKEAS